MLDKIYIGDGIYIEDKGFEIHLTTENGIHVKNRIIIEPDEWKYIVEYMERVCKDRESQANHTLTPGGP